MSTLSSSPTCAGPPTRLSRCPKKSCPARCPFSFSTVRPSRWPSAWKISDRRTSRLWSSPLRHSAPKVSPVPLMSKPLSPRQISVRSWWEFGPGRSLLYVHWTTGVTTASNFFFSLKKSRNLQQSTLGSAVLLQSAASGRPLTRLLTSRSVFFCIFSWLDTCSGRQSSADPLPFYRQSLHLCFSSLEWKRCCINKVERS